jgi:hypothetical protein
MWEIKG